jgi:hypothetical protein
MTSLTREQILAANDLRTEVVEVPEWGGPVKVRSLTGRERDRYQETVIKMRGTDPQIVLRDLRVKLIARTAIGDDGKLLFGDDDVEALANKNAAALERVFTAAQRLCGLSATDVEEMVKNSVNGQNGDSGSD